jgi:hypothetical protein
MFAYIMYINTTVVETRQAVNPETLSSVNFLRASFNEMSKRAGFKFVVALGGGGGQQLPSSGIKKIAFRFKLLIPC